MLILTTDCTDKLSQFPDPFVSLAWFVVKIPKIRLFLRLLEGTHWCQSLYVYTHSGRFPESGCNFQTIRDGCLRVILI